MINQDITNDNDTLYKLYQEHLIDIYEIHDVCDLTERQRELLTALYNESLKPQYREDALFEGVVNPNPSSYITRFMKGEINELELAQSLTKIMVEYHRDAIDEDYRLAVQDLVYDTDDFECDRDFLDFHQPRDFLDTDYVKPLFQLAD